MTNTDGIYFHMLKHFSNVKNSDYFYNNHTELVNPCTNDLNFILHDYPHSLPFIWHMDQNESTCPVQGAFILSLRIIMCTYNN